MNVWVKRTRKRVKCFYCQKYIEIEEYQVSCQYYMKLKHSDKTWTKVMHFHAQNPNCWLDRAIAELESRPYVEMRGRRPDALSDSDRLVRQKILRRRASVIQRIDLEMGERESGPRRPGRPNKLAHLVDLLEMLKAEIEPFGGVPKSWKL